MKKIKRQNTPARLTLFAGATALMALTPQMQAQTSVDALLNKLEQKGILTVDEAKQLKAENQQDYAADMNKAINAKFQMPDWVTSYRLYGDFRGRFDYLATDNPGVPNPTDPVKGLSSQDRIRGRYRLRVGFDVNMKDNLQAGFRLGSGDGNALSNNTTEENNGTKKPVWVDAAFGKWTPINNETAMLAATLGKMDQPFQVSPMEFDPDYTPEGVALQGKYKINDIHSFAVNGAAFILDEVKGSSRDPFITGGQAIWNASWTTRLATSLGFAAFDIVNPDALGLSGFPNPNPANYNPGGVPNNNQGNTRNPTTGNLVYHYNPLIASASATYTLDNFPLYKGKFPMKISGEYMNNPAAASSGNNAGYWAGAQLGKSGKKGTWDISYRYQYLEADSWYDELVDDDNVAFYSNTSLTQPLNGWVAGTNIKGHQIKFNYALADSLTFSVTAFFNQLIKPDQNIGAAGEPQNNATHIMADLMWKF